MANGLLRQLPPGLSGYVAGEQMANQRGMNELQKLQGLLGLREEMQNAPLRNEMLRLQVENARSPAPARVDLGGEIGLIDPRTGQILGKIPKVATPDAIMRERGATERHQIPSGSSALSAQTAIRGQDLGAGTARRGQEITVRGQDLTNQRALEVQSQGRVPLGYRAVPSGLEPIPGGPADIKAGAEAEKTKRREAGAISQADIVIKKVDEALKQTGFLTTGFTGATLGRIPGTSAYNLDKALDTVKANIGFKELQAMREASPTGGALGQIAVRELDFLQAVIASLDKGQSEDVLRANLEAVKTHFTNWKNAVQQAGGTQNIVPPGTPMPGYGRREGDKLQRNPDGSYTYRP